MRKKVKFDYTNKWYMHNPTSVLENDTHKLLWVFDIQTHHLILVRRPELIIINNNKKKKKKRKKRIYIIVDLAVPADHRVKLKESENKDEYQDLARGTEKTVRHESDVYTNYNWSSWCRHERICIRTGGHWNKRTTGYHPNYCILRSARILRRVLETWGHLL